MTAIIVAFLLFIIWAVQLRRAIVGLKLIPELPRDQGMPDRLPLVSVIVAAKEEQEHIGETIQHLLKQTYPKLEIIAVNDRSNDATGSKLDALKAWSDGKDKSSIPLKVIHITSLPAGWLGKNHALYQGYLQAKGRYLLFTDADVRFEPNTIADCVAYAEQQYADHVTLIPKMISPTFILKAFVHFFLFSLCMLISPWAGNNDFQRRRGMGVGAFNMLRREAYEGLGTHRALAMRPDDDLRLGMLVKQGGWRQRILTGYNRLSVEWYPSLQQAVKGLEKNVYAGFGYRLWFASLAIVGQLFLFIFPFLALLWFRGASFYILLLAILFMIITYRLFIRGLSGERGLEAVFLPISASVLIYILTRSVVLAHRRGGVFWRGTFYKLKELKRLYR